MSRDRVLRRWPAVCSPHALIAFVLGVVMVVSPSRAAEASPAAAAPHSLLATAPTIRSANWSGYTVSGGPFRSVTGTFNVPSLTTASHPNHHFSEWVGIDGARNHDLIQAGVALFADPADPATFDVRPWWEIFPKGQTLITSMTVHAGDAVRVTIGRFTGSTTWRITIADNSNGESFTTDRTYTGPADSADWIVEAPKTNSGQTSIAAYSPHVLFSDMRLSHSAVDAVDRWVIVDPHTSNQTSTPSNVDSTGFNVAYGATEIPAPYATTGGLIRPSIPFQT